MNTRMEGRMFALLAGLALGAGTFAPATAHAEESDASLVVATKMALWTADGVSWALAEPTTLQKSQHGSYRLAASGDGTLVTYLLTLESRMPMIGLMKRKAERMIIDAALKELKKRVESLQ